VSASALVAAVVVPAVVVALVAPRGWLARASLRRRRGPLSRPDRLAPPRPGPTGVSVRSLPRTLGALGGSLRRRLGRRPDPMADRRVGATLVAAVAVAVLVGPLLVPVVVGGGWASGRITRRSARLRHERAVRTTLPDAVDLFRVAVGAGLSVHQAVDVVAVRAPDPVGATLREARRRVSLGVRLGDALDALDELGDPAAPLAAGLRGAARYGTPLGPSLERVGADARVLRRRRAEEDARRLPVQLLFPLVLCVLPAFGLLAVVPLLVASVGSLSL